MRVVNASHGYYYLNWGIHKYINTSIGRLWITVLGLYLLLHVQMGSTLLTLMYKSVRVLNPKLNNCSNTTWA